MRRIVAFAILLGMNAAPAWADRLCVVADPSGTPLNVRSGPNGRILGALHNGAAVRLLDSTRDETGRPWAFVAPTHDGRSGWVYRGYIECE